MKRLIFILITILMLSNAVWSYLYFNKNSDETAANHTVRLYVLNGTGEKWDVKNYKIIISSDKILRGHAELVYKGSSKEIENSTYFNYTFYESGHDNQKEAVYAKDARSFGGPISILDNNKDVGSITGEYSYGETKKDRNNYESTTLEISWKDNEGEDHLEMIELDIDSEIVMK
ncbi:hypothetical protein [Paenibacillus sp. IHBB 10380]|uniref:hypothetical protein n=1 Tax=Paenibacillus sp. IHBB 10380 TaxID=1566358 RepID=UPI0005CFDFDA|nr:hypothetical protein [Paenibacillus sp. IHBB 10380]AJS60685.1 hypothetical protein UB51_21985 [Paenibacillus sp. IHBB 10380]